MKFILAILALAFIAPANAKPVKKPDANGNAITKRCDPPRRWIEVNALADDAGRPSKAICK